jgi:hypothetical protein
MDSYGRQKTLTVELTMNRKPCTSRLFDLFPYLWWPQAPWGAILKAEFRPFLPGGPPGQDLSRRGRRMVEGMRGLRSVLDHAYEMDGRLPFIRAGERVMANVVRNARAMKRKRKKKG